MAFFLVVVSGLFGFIVGSFSNALIWRLHSGESIVKGRSHCVHCGHTLAWYDLIPMVSFVILRGDCRYCGKSISLQYPLVELLSAALFAFIAWRALQFIDPSTDFVFYILYTVFLAIIFSGLLIILVYDLKHYLIPDKVLFPLIAVTVLVELFGVLNLEFGIWNLEFVSDFGFRISDLSGLASAFISALLASGFFFALFFVSAGRWMGFGDVKLAFFMGLFLGYPAILVALFFAFTSGAIIGVALIAAKMKTIKSQVPFGPYLIVGTFVAFFWSDWLVDWYFNLFF